MSFEQERADDPAVVRIRSIQVQTYFLPLNLMTAQQTTPGYCVLPLQVVQKAAKKMLTARQLREGISVTKLLRFYPNISELSIEPCGAGMELRIESPSINQQGWLRAIFWIHETSKTIYIVDLFWKKTNKVSVADIHRANHRIKALKAGMS